MCIGGGNGKPDSTLVIKSGYGNPNLSDGPLITSGKQSAAAKRAKDASPTDIDKAAQNYGIEMGQPKPIDLQDDSLTAARQSELLRTGRGRRSTFLTGPAADARPLGKTLLGGG
jgi:hypothetical protein